MAIDGRGSGPRYGSSTGPVASRRSIAAGPHRPDRTEGHRPHRWALARRVPASSSTRARRTAAGRRERWRHRGARGLDRIQVVGKQAHVPSRREMVELRPHRRTRRLPVALRPPILGAGSPRRQSRRRQRPSRVRKYFWWSGEASRSAIRLPAELVPGARRSLAEAMGRRPGAPRTRAPTSIR